MERPKIYRVVWGEIRVADLISEAPASFLVVDKNGIKGRSWKNRKWGGQSGGGIFQTEKSFTSREKAMLYAKRQTTEYHKWAFRHYDEASQIEKKTEKEWGAK